VPRIHDDERRDDDETLCEDEAGEFVFRRIVDEKDGTRRGRSRQRLPSIGIRRKTLI
jgi:hypothetical protein